MMDGKFFKIFGGAFAAFGMLFFFIGLIFYVKTIEFQKTAVPVAGVIEDIERYSTGSGNNRRVTHEVYVSYYYNDVYYADIRIPTYTSSMQIGKGIDLLVDPNDPYTADVAEGRNLGLLMFCGIGGLFATIGFVILGVSIKKSVSAKKLKETGMLVKARVEDFTENVNVSVNGKHPYRIICSAMIRETVYHFQSQNVYYYPPSRYNQGDFVDVYVDIHDESKYYVDVAK